MSTASHAGPLSPAEASLLLDHLIGDMAFRAQFITDPVGALAGIGITAPCDTACLAVGELASPSEFASIRAELEDYLVNSTASMTIIFCFEAGRVSDTIS